MSSESKDRLAPLRAQIDSLNTLPADAAPSVNVTPKWIWEHAFSLAEVKGMLGLNEAELLHRIDIRHLYAVRRQQDIRFPHFQFAADQPLPHLEDVLPLLADVSPLALITWFYTPLPLIGNQSPLTPIAWLSTQGDWQVLMTHLPRLSS